MSSQGDNKTIFPCGTPTTRLASPKRGCGINQVSVAASPKAHRVPRTYECQRFLTDREVERARALFLERGGIPADQDPVSALSTLFQNLQLTAPPSTTELRSYLNTLRASSHNHRVEEEVKVPTDVIDVQTFVDILNVHKRHFLRQKHKNDEVWAAFVNLREESLSKCSEEVEGEDGTNEVEDDMNVASARHHGKNSVSLHRMQEIMNLYGLTFNVYDFYHKACIHPSDKVDFEAFRYCCGAEDLDTVALFRRLGGHEDLSGSIPAVRFAHEHPYLACLDSEMRCSLLTSLGAPLEGQFDYHDVCAISIRLHKEAKKHAKFLHQQNALESDSTLNSQMNPKEPFGQSTKQNAQRCEEQNQQSLVPLQEAEPSLTHDEFSGSFHPSFPDDTSLLLPDSRTQNDFTSYDRENLTQMNPSHFREGGPSTPRDLQRRHLGSRMSGSISWNTLATSNFNYNTSSPTTNRLLSRLEQIDSESTMYRSRIRKHAPLTAEVRRRSSRFLHLATRKGLARSWNGVEDERHLQENAYEHGESHVQDMASRHVNLHMQSVPRRPWPARAPHSAQFYRSAPRSQSLLTDSFEVNIRAGASLRHKTQNDSLYCSILGHEEFIQTMRKYPNIGAHID